MNLLSYCMGGSESGGVAAIRFGSNLRCSQGLASGFRPGFPCFWMGDNRLGVESEYKVIAGKGGEAEEVGHGSRHD